MIVVLTIWVLFAWMVGSQARAKNYSFAKFFCLALVFSPFALSAALWVLPRGPEKPAPDGTSNS